MIANAEILKPLKFTNRVRKYILIPYCLDIISRRGNLKEAILKVHMSTLDASLSNKDFWKPDVSEAEKKENLQKVRKKIEEKNRKNIEDYLPILFNQALIMICTICDTFLFDLLKVLTKKEPNILKGLADKNDIEISEIIDLGDYPKIFNAIQNQILQRFDFASIEKKIEILKKLGIDTNTAFKLKFHTQQIQQKYSDGYKFFLNAYKERNNIVHRNQLPLRTYQDLEKISIFFDYFISGLALITGKHFGIPTDLELFFQNPQSVDVD